MEEKQEEENLIDLLQNSPGETEVKRYGSGEMISCAKCSRSNPPNRLDCMYCGLELEISEKQKKSLKPILRNTEKWTNAGNLIYLSRSSPWCDKDLLDVSNMVRLDPKLLERIVKCGCPMPIARSDQKREVGIVIDRLGEMGVETRVISDEEFQLKHPARRLRRIGFREGIFELTLFNLDETVHAEAKDVRLIVNGSLYERRIESSERHSRKKENKLLETAEISADQLVIDIYVAEDPIGYRITANGFDFSCLGDKKGLIANENIRQLDERLREHIPNAVFDNGYAKVREYLSGVWEVDERLDSKGLKRKGFGAFNRGKLTTTDNALQFTKYSRLQWHLL